MKGLEVFVETVSRRKVITEDAAGQNLRQFGSPSPPAEHAGGQRSTSSDGGA